MPRQMIHTPEGMTRWTRRFMHWCYQKKSSFIWLILWLGLVSPFARFSSVSGSEEDLENRSLARLADLERIQKEQASARLGVMNTGYAPGRSFLVNIDVFSSLLSPDLSKKRTGPALIGSVMALLATFEAANVLPPEGTSQANQLIHGLIQLQSVLVKSQDLAWSEYVSAAVDYRFKKDRTKILQSIHQKGLTSKVLEALVIYDKKMPIWDQPGIVQIFQRHNVSRPDWLLIEQIFAQADAVYGIKGISIHEAYEQWRSQMPGGRL
jgi:hypothetical protein